MKTNTTLLHSLALVTLICTTSSNAQTYSDYTQVGTIDFIESPAIGSQPPVAKLIDTDFRGRWEDGHFFRVNKAEFDASIDVATVTVQLNTLLTPRPGALRAAIAEGVSEITYTETPENSDMFNASFWCIGSLDDNNSSTDDTASATFSLPTLNLADHESIEWTVWVSPDIDSPNNLTIKGESSTEGESYSLGNSMFSRADTVSLTIISDSITITNKAIVAQTLNEGNMNTFWVGARVVPEPSSSLLSLIGLLGLVIRRRR